MLTNSYATLDEFLALPDITSNEPRDDVFIEQLLDRSSREFDGDTGHWFYAYQQTRSYDTPRDRCLKLDAPLLAVTTITNGNNATIPATEYRLYPLNGLNAAEIRIKAGSSVIWEPSTDGDREGAITVAGCWGYVDRTATDPQSANVISNTKSAVLMLTLALYRKRYGVNTEGGATTITGAGVVITPRDKSREYMNIVSLYRRHL